MTEKTAQPTRSVRLMCCKIFLGVVFAVAIAVWLFGGDSGSGSVKQAERIAIRPTQPKPAPSAGKTPAKQPKAPAGGSRVSAHDLKTSRRYAASGTVPLMPVHRDDLRGDAMARIGQMRQIENPTFTVLAVRLTDYGGARRPWYHVRLSGGRSGWFNSTALLACHIIEVAE